MSSTAALTNLPLNIIFRILLDLNIDDLQNIGRTCTLLRTLANESIMYRNTMFYHALSENDSNSASVSRTWTKRLVFDVFDILNGNRKMLNFLNRGEEPISVVEMMSFIQKKFKLGENEILQKTITYEKLESENSKSNSNIARETLRYIKILNGINHIINAQGKNLNRDIGKSNDDVISMVPENAISDIDSATPSPITFNHSRSSTSSTLFSDTEWNSPAEDHPKITIPKDEVMEGLMQKVRETKSSKNNKPSIDEKLRLEKEDTNTPIEDDSIIKLRNSKKVKDKAALFEKFLTIQEKEEKNNQTKSYGSLVSKDVNTHRPMRDISRSYLQNLEKNGSTPIERPVNFLSLIHI